MTVSIQAMTIFVRAVEQNSFIGASRSLLIDPAAVSRAIRALEGALGVVLFARSTRTLKLTPEGARFYRDCLGVLRRFTEATQRYRAGAAPTGPLRIGMAPGLRRRILLRALPPFQRQYPQIDVIMVSVDEPAIAIGKDIDVLVRARSVRRRGQPRPQPQGLIVRKLFESPYVVCASQAYLDRRGKPRQPAELVDHDCIAHLNLDYDTAHEWHFAKAADRQAVRFAPKLRAQGVAAVCEAALAGCGIARILAANIEDELKARSLVPVLTDWECTGVPPMLAVYRKTRPVMPQLVAFVHHLSEAFQRYDRSASKAA